MNYQKNPRHLPSRRSKKVRRTQGSAEPQLPASRSHSFAATVTAAGTLISALAASGALMLATPQGAQPAPVTCPVTRNFAGSYGELGDSMADPAGQHYARSPARHVLALPGTALDLGRHA